MDSMINRLHGGLGRSDDATPGDIRRQAAGPRRTGVFQRCREAYKEVPIILGDIEDSLRTYSLRLLVRQVRRSVVVDAKCDLLLCGNAERAIVEDHSPPQRVI
jgi:hypothetical protein